MGYSLLFYLLPVSIEERKITLLIGRIQEDVLNISGRAHKKSGSGYAMVSVFDGLWILE